MTSAADLILWNVVEQHFDEAAFALQQLDAAIDSPLYTFEDLGKTVEGRVVAHLDGLALGEAAVADVMLWPALTPDADDELAAAAAVHALLLEQGTAALDRVLELQLGLPDGPARAGVQRALGATARRDVSARALAFAEHVDDPAPLVDIAAARGGALGSKHAAWIMQNVRSEDPGRRAVAARASTWLARAQALQVAEYLANDADAATCAAALGSGLVHGSAAVTARAHELAVAPHSGASARVRASRLWLALDGSREYVDALVKLLARDDARSDAIWALGFTGRIDAVDRLLALLDDEEVGPLAAEAISGIVGLGRDQQEYWRDGPRQPIPEAHELDADLPEEDLDRDPTPSPDDALPIPNPSAFQDAWPELRARLDPRLRYHEGRPLLHASDYAAALTLASCRRRHAISFELAVRTRGACRVPSRAFTSLQRAALTTLPGLGPIDGARSFNRIS